MSKRYQDINRVSADLEGAQGWKIENHPESLPTKSRKHKKCKYCNNAGTCKSPVSLYKGSLCKGQNCPSYTNP